MKKAIFLVVVLFLAKFSAPAQALIPSDAESKISFVIKNMGMNVEGTLKGLKGNMTFDPKNLGGSSFDITVDVNTINTGIDKRDKHLRTGDFFHEEKFPVIRLKSLKIVSKGGTNYATTAQLTIKNVSKNIGITFSAVPSTAGYAFTGNFTINRKDFGVGGSSMTMGDEVNVTLSVAAKK